MVGGLGRGGDAVHNQTFFLVISDRCLQRERKEFRDWSTNEVELNWGPKNYRVAIMPIARGECYRASGVLRIPIGGESSLVFAF